ncbi:MAG: hypothetical protein AAGE52_39015 [Myxococcota bacterium]
MSVADSRVVAGTPHPVAFGVGALLAGASLIGIFQRSANDIIGGEYICGAVCAIGVFLGALVGGGRATRIGVLARLAPSPSARARKILEKEINAAINSMRRPVAGIFILATGGVALLLKPFVVSVQGFRITFDERPPQLVEWGWFENIHRSFVVSGVVLVLLALMLLSRPANR